MVIIRLILTILIFIIPILSYLTEGIMSWMGYDGKHCGEIEMANKIVREIIHAKGIDIGIYTKDFENEYISLTDIAKYRNDKDPRFVIQNWMRNRNTVEFWRSVKNFTIRILTVCNSRRLEVRQD